MGTHSSLAAKWSLGPPSAVVLNTSQVPATELSGVTYLGPAETAGKHLFAAVQDSGGRLITMEVTLNPAGAITSAVAIESLTLAHGLDFEGAAYTNAARNSVFLAEEDNPGVREYDLSTGNLLQVVSIPSVFTNIRNNRGFESLTRNLAGTRMWTGNEEALTVDGPLANLNQGTVVRLLELNVVENSVTAGKQYAYEVDPIHAGSSTSTETRSGLVELVVLPDGTLLAMERSLASSFNPPPFQNRIYTIDFAGATDVSVAPFATGLIGKTYTPVGKELLWSGAAGGGFGQNLEGLTLGPRLDENSWVLIGVVDDGDMLSTNTVVSFVVTATPSADFDGNGMVDGKDFLAWQRGFGQSVGAQFGFGDANRDGAVDSLDLAVWETSYGSATSAENLLAVPEPSTLLLAALGMFIFRSLLRPIR